MPPTEWPEDTRLYLGLMSGTSADGIDAALVRFTADGPETLTASSYAYAPDLKARVLQLSQQGGEVCIDEVARLDHRIGMAFAEAARALLQEAAVEAGDVAAIGSHGQTLRHAPMGVAPFTWQAGDPSLIVERTGITTVADFRRRDVAAGGQGAPLMPAFHAALLAQRTVDLAVLNLGGIANLTLLPRQGPVRGFDTGPANGLMDAWVQLHHGEPFDRDGRFAASGRVDTALLARLLDDPYFEQAPPKSTGRDHFHLNWLRARLEGSSADAAQVQATLLECTARSITQALAAQLPGCSRLYVCGGGVHNASLMRRLAQLLPGVPVESTAVLGIDPDFVEAIGFAWLARQTLNGLTGNLPAVTGARGARILGAIHPA